MTARGWRCRCLVVLGAALIVGGSGLAAQQPAQAAGDSVQALQRFSGSTGVLINGAVRPVRVDVRSWTIWERRKLDRLTLPVQGTTVVEVLGGTLEVTVAGRKTRYRPGQFFTLEAGQRFLLETGNDAATFRTVTVARQ